MASLARIPLGAPGIYPYPDIPIRALTGVRMDVCAFVGVAPRGPVREVLIDQTTMDGTETGGIPEIEFGSPVRRTVVRAVESFDEYRELYGGFEGPGLLPFAVSTFFEQGGRRAYIARIVHDYSQDVMPDPSKNNGGVASGAVPGAIAITGPLTLRARNEGIWGNVLRASLRFTARPVLFDASTSTVTGFTLQDGENLSAGALLRLVLPGGARQFRFADSIIKQRVTFDVAATAAPESADLVEGLLLIDDGQRFERHERLGFSPLHPRFLATVLTGESQLVYPDAAWIADDVRPADIGLAEPAPSDLFMGGEDRYADITPDDFFDPLWTKGDEDPGNGVHSLVQLDDLSLLVVPDLYSARPLAEIKPIDDVVSVAGATFARCVDIPPAPPPPPQSAQDPLEKLRLDPKVDLEAIITLHERLIDLVEQLRSFVVLLDVPPGLTRTQILKWRARLNSTYAATYHPWLKVRDEIRDALISIPPSSTAAGIIARVENESGISYGPANVIASQVVDVEELVSPARHDELHPLGINVYLRERDGVRLTAARTIGSDPDYRQLSVRRLIVLLRRTLERQTQWMVFEPNDAALRSEVRHFLGVFLRQLFLGGAFRGATEAESFFVRCDETNNPPRLADAGQILTEIGVAPAEPLEFIVLRIMRDGDGTLNIQEAK